jgi:RNA polymerase sigma-54 factor
MAQKLIQTQAQKQVQVQRLSQQQMLQVKLLEMPVTELEQNISAELDDNPALEVSTDNPDEVGEDSGDVNDSPDDDPALTEEEQTEINDRDDELDKALESISSDDEMPVTYGRQDDDNADYEEMVYGDTTSFYDRLKEQMGYIKLSPKQQSIMEYLIGSLDSDGLLRKNIDAISDELAVYNNIDASTGEIDDVLEMLQSFDPAGIGARSLQECLLLQIERRPEGKVKSLMKRVIGDMFNEFTKKHWDKISRELNLTDTQTQALHDEILKLNPKPGASLGETEGSNVQQITPDFIVDTADDGSISFSISNGRMPELKVSPSFSDMVDTYKNNKQSMSRQAKEALLYAKEKVDKAKGFIEAVKMRRHTLYITMKTIIEWQRKFFEDGDEADLKPMILKDIADKTGLDISTISRVSNQKYAQTKWGTFPLRFFFSDSYTTGEGEEMSTRKIKLALKEIIEKEDKQRPMSDDALTKILTDKGFPIARRTVAKYREQLDIPVARLRKSVNS